MVDRWEDGEERDRALRTALGALGRRHGSFWLLTAVAAELAVRLYGPPRRFAVLFAGGVAGWGLLFVALPVFTAASALCRLYETHYGGATPRMAGHRLVAALNVGLVLFALMGLILEWGAVGFLLVLCPALSCLSCAALARGPE
ncbi:MAG: hypothetical protein Kow0092_32440 [Deferrisomatales bacterium]